MARGRAGLAASAALALLLIAPAAAESPPPAPPPRPRLPVRTVIQRPPGRRRVIVIAEQKIEGRIQKPQAFYILQRSSLNYEKLELEESFVPKILRSVEGPPF